ncbi:hypothetical protein Ae263Ps1_1614c [Pseudonocardia sp. Ae263_Ps1]|nr:hypothetical protein Ae263Ps1_1614c [Pseudonocardia sp. Ae263_Ps1]
MSPPGPRSGGPGPAPTDGFRPDRSRDRSRSGA